MLDFYLFPYKIYLKESLSHIRLLSIVFSFFGALLITQSNTLFINWNINSSNQQTYTNNYNDNI